MMSKVTGFKAVDELGFPVLCDAQGNNVAIRCTSCGGPVLAVIRENQRGNSSVHPAVCPACGAKYWVSLNEVLELLTVHRMK
jgi:NAD-dependent SIR2 family protein deacetylase